VASIHIIQGPDKGRRIELSPPEIVMGRQDADVELSDSTISRNHLKFRQDGQDWYLEDLGSANGTFLNGMKLTRPMPVKLGDQIRCGQSLLVFARSDSSPMGGTGSVDIDEDGRLVDAAIVATVPSNEDSVIIPTPEAGVQAIGNLRTIYDLMQEISSIFDIDQMLHHVLDKVFELLRPDRGFIMLKEDVPDGSEPQLVLKVSRVADEDHQGEIPISRTIIKEVFRNQVGVLSSNAMGDRRFSAGKSVQNFSIHSAICVPIKGRDEILGVLHADCSVSELTYSTEQLRLLTAIGYQTGLAIENFRLYEAKMQSERLAAVGETVAVISHHAKNIVQALMAGIDVVEMALNADNLDKAKQSWPIVQRGLTRTHNLILDMLAFSKDRRPTREEINVNDVLTECAELVTPGADERHIAVMTDLAELPPLSAEFDALQHGFLNLLTNALDAVDEGSGVVTVTSKYDSLERAILVQIIDNGCGIEADQLHTIFQPFISGKGHRGTGLGLAVARKIFIEHGGGITLESTPGEGTTFTISLPLMPAESDLPPDSDDEEEF
jgi:two-component system NtrC family sensor kinase